MGGGYHRNSGSAYSPTGARNRLGACLPLYLRAQGPRRRTSGEQTVRAIPGTGVGKSSLGVFVARVVELGMTTYADPSTAKRTAPDKFSRMNLCESHYRD